MERTGTENTGNRGVEGADIFPVGAKPADNRLLPACQIFYLGFTLEKVTKGRIPRLFPSYVWLYPPSIPPLVEQDLIYRFLLTDSTYVSYVTHREK